MAETLTPNYHWVKPDIGGDASNWGNVLNTGFDAVDAQVHTNQVNMGGYLPLTGGTITGSLAVTSNFNVSGSGFFASVNATGNVNAVSVVASNTVQGAFVNSTGNVSASGDIVATGNITASTGMSAGAGGIGTTGLLYGAQGVNGGSGTIQTTGNISGNTVTANQIINNGTTFFHHNTYTDFNTVVGTGNNSRGIQFANGWIIQAIAANLAYYFGIGGTNVGWLDYLGNFNINGQGYKPGGGGWVSPSDERVKRNVKPYRSGLKELDQLEPVSYAYNGKGGTKDDGKRYVGLVAQAAQRAMPSLVHEMPGKFDEKLDDQLALDASELVFTLINAVKELSARVEELEAR